jgi:transposase
VGKAGIEEVADEEFERVLDRVCAIDVAKESGQVCVRTSRGERRYSKLWTVNATTRAILELGEQLVRDRIEKVTLESTSDYWRIFFYLLEGCGLSVQLVNARDVKNVPGRPKTDKHDSVWLAKLTERGMLRPSFVPPREIRVLRDYTRMRIDLVRDRARHWQRLEKLLEDSLIKVSAVASTLTTVSTRNMIDALIRGERDPCRLAGLARGRMRGKHHALVEALTGQFDDHHAELAQVLLGQIDALDVQIDKLTDRINQLIADLPAEATADTDGGHTDDDPPPPQPGTGGPRLSTVQRLTQIPGISIEGAQVILAELGLDMTRFPTPEHLVSWAKLCPRTIQSGAKHKTGKTRKATPTSRACSAKPPAPPPAPTPSSANATDASSNVEAKAKRSSLSPAPPSPSSGMSWPTRTPPSTTSARTTTPTTSTRSARSATTSAR